jgi:hypothetical protein
MRAINITNEKKRDAVVGFEGPVKKPKVRMVLPNGKDKRNVKLLKTTVTADALAAKYGDLSKAGEALVAGDPEIDIETTGKILDKTRKLYIDGKGEIAFHVDTVQTLYNPDGTERETRELSKAMANVAGETPLQWTGRQFPKDKAARQFVFTRHYQLRHTNGLTYDFLYGMAKTLSDAGALMFIGGGKKGNEPLVLSAGGEPYRAFLEGRIDGEKYALILHLTSMELKALPEEAK